MKLAVAKRAPLPLQKRIRVPLVCMGMGFVHYGIGRAAAFLAGAGRIPQDNVFTIGCVTAGVLFLVSGLLFLRKLKQDEIVRSAGYVVLYYFVAFIVAQELIARAQALPAWEWIFIPVWPFTYLHAGLLKVGFTNMYALAPALLSPLFYAMFGQPRAVEAGDHIAAPASKEEDAPDIQEQDGPAHEEPAQEPKE